MSLFEDWFSECLIIFDDVETIKIDINIEELKGLKQDVFFRELHLNLRELQKKNSEDEK